MIDKKAVTSAARSKEHLSYYLYEPCKALPVDDLKRALGDADDLLHALLFPQPPPAPPAVAAPASTGSGDGMGAPTPATSAGSCKSAAGPRVRSLAPMIAKYHLHEDMLPEDPMEVSL